MRYLAALLIMLALPAQANEYRVEFLRAYDGDTPTVIVNGRREAVRIANIDTPEIKGKCPAENELARRARDFTITWGKRSGELILTTGSREREKYGRLLGNLRNSDGEDLGEKLIEAGLAVRWEGHRHRGWCE